MYLSELSQDNNDYIFVEEVRTHIYTPSKDSLDRFRKTRKIKLVQSNITSEVEIYFYHKFNYGMKRRIFWILEKK